MAIVEQVTCDVCGKAKCEVNHWWLYGTSKSAIEIIPWDEQKRGWNHACGQECVIQAVNRWMGEQSK